MDYDDGLLSSFTNPRNHSSTFTYDAAGRLERDSDAGGGYSDLTREQASDGYEVTVASKLGREHKVEVRRLANGETRRRSTDAAGMATTQITTEDGGQTTQTMPSGTEITQSLAPDPRLGADASYPASTTVQTPEDRELVIERTREAELTDPEDPLSIETLTETVSVNGNEATTVFDTDGDFFLNTSAEGRESGVAINADGQPVSAATDGIEPVDYGYDGRGRLITIDQGSRDWALTYDVDGNFDTSTDSLGRVESFDYDDAGRVIEQTLPDSRVIAYDYDANGNLISVTPPGRPDHDFGHDEVDNLGSATPPSVGNGADPTTYDYDDDHQLTAVNLPDARLSASTTTPPGVLRQPRARRAGDRSHLRQPDRPARHDQLARQRRARVRLGRRACHLERDDWPCGRRGLRQLRQRPAHR